MARRPDARRNVVLPGGPSLEHEKLPRAKAARQPTEERFARCANEAAGGGSARRRAESARPMIRSLR